MTRLRVSILLLSCALFGILFATMATAGNENILDTGVSGTELVMADMALRDTTSYTGNPSDWTIYFHPGIRFGTDDRVIGFYDVMVPVYLSDTSMLFVNPRFSHDSDDGHEWNLGGGYRHILWDNQLMLGVNAYYDIKKHGDSGKYFDQWGMGFEAMGEFDNVLASGGGLGLTGRFNFYVPLEGSKSAGTGKEYSFNSLGIVSTGGGTVTMYEPLTGLDYEMGMRIPYLSEYVETWAYAGGYHYWGRESGNLDGFCGRMEVIPTDFLSLDFEYRNDNWHGNELYGEVKVEVPFSIGNLVQGKNPFEDLGSRFGGSRDLAERMVEPVRRDIDIRIETNTTTGGGSTTTGGLIEEIIFVSEGGEADPAADGSYEHPYGSITNAMADARLGVTAFTIHVMNDNGGDGLVGTGTVNVGNILLWGSGVSHPLYPTISNLTPGHPSMSGTLNLDADYVEIAGLGFYSGNIGIQLYDNVGSIIRNNIIDLAFNGDIYGIYSNNPGGSIGSETDPIIISGNTITLAAPPSGWNEADGIFFRTSSATGNVFAEITGNSISTTANGYARGVYCHVSFGGTGAGSAARPFLVSGNSFDIASDDRAEGISMTSPSDSLIVEIIGNSIDVTSFSDEAYGAALYSNWLGNARTALFQNNSGTIDGDGSDDIIMLLVRKNASAYIGNGGDVNWSGNSFTPLDGGAPAGWTGNYDAGDSLPAAGTGPVLTNFGVGDTITP